MIYIPFWQTKLTMKHIDVYLIEGQVLYTTNRSDTSNSKCKSEILKQFIF